MTPEEHDGVQVLEPHKFQMYGSLSEAIQDYADFINRRYASGARVYNIDARTPFTYIDSIAKHYASDSRYAWKVKSIIYEYDLQKYDW